MYRKTIALTMLFVGGVTAVFLMIDGLATAQGVGSETIVLYDGSLGTLPGDQGFTFGEFPGGATQTISDGGVILDTTANIGIQAGYGVTTSDSVVLDRHTGYKVLFQVQVLEETSVSNDRAGFSIIVLSQDVNGIELGFWDDQIFAQEDDSQNPGDLLTRAETAVFDTTAGSTLYELLIFNDAYTLFSGGMVVLNGRLRDYTSFNGFPDPYETPNFIFLGDNTTSAQARIKLDYVAIRPNDVLFLPVIIRP